MLLFEKTVLQASNSTYKLRAAATERAHSPEKIAEAIGLYQRMLKDWPEEKKGTLQRRVYKQTGISPRVLRYHLRKARDFDS